MEQNISSNEIEGVETNIALLHKLLWKLVTNSNTTQAYVPVETISLNRFPNYYF